MEPDRLRFDFAHHGPLSPQQLADVESIVNRGILDGTQVVFEEKPKSEAIAGGAMHLFNEKYGDIVRVVEIGDYSVELCGGTHVRRTAEIGLVTYTLLILIRNIVGGIRAVPAEVRDAAQGMGYTPRQILLRIELPLALGVIFAGIRVATITTIGLVTVTALIGEGGLGYFILLGIQLFFSTPLVVGALGSVALAVIALAAGQQVEGDGRIRSPRHPSGSR